MRLINIFVFLFICIGCQENTENNSLQSKENNLSEPLAIKSDIEDTNFTQNTADRFKEQVKDEEEKNVDIKNKEVKKETKNTNKNKGTEIKKAVMLDVPIIAQNPELKYGCEVTSLTMVLQYAGVEINKVDLANKLNKDSDPVKKAKTGDITQWGNPNEGFVGDITGKNMGYAVFDKPIEDLMNQYLSGRSVNLTGKSFNEVLQQINKEKPVVVWTTGDFKLPDRWESWKHGEETIKTPLDLHAVVLVGYDEYYVYVNDPLTGIKAQKVNKQSFIDSWVALEKRAISYE